MQFPDQAEMQSYHIQSKVYYEIYPISQLFTIFSLLEPNYVEVKAIQNEHKTQMKVGKS